MEKASEWRRCLGDADVFRLRQLWRFFLLVHVSSFELLRGAHGSHSISFVVWVGKAQDPVLVGNGSARHRLSYPLRNCRTMVSLIGDEGEEQDEDENDDDLESC